MSTDLRPDQLRFGHTDEDSAILVDDYPYGRRVRTQIRYWIETTKNGDRFCSQTLNPKTGRWNKPKKSTYSPVGVIFIEDETGYVRWVSVTHYSNDEWLAHFIAITEGNLSDAQKRQLAGIIGTKRAMENVTFSVREGSFTPEEEAEQAHTRRVIARQVAIESQRARGELS